MTTKQLLKTLFLPLALSFLVVGCGCPLIRGDLPEKPKHITPAKPYDAKSWQDVFNQLGVGEPQTAFGVGLTYKGHIRATTTWYDRNAIVPVFMKNVSPTPGGGDIEIPSKEEITQVIATLDHEYGVAEKEEIGDKITTPLIDYEVELGLAILEDIDWAKLDCEPDYAVKVGYFIANDVSCRNLVMAADRQRFPKGLKDPEYDAIKYAYWGAGKSFPGFLPVGEEIVIPNGAPKRGELFPADLKCLLNGNEVQSENTHNMLISAEDILSQIYRAHHVRGYPDRLPGKGDIILTGTPKGGAIEQVSYYPTRLFAEKVLGWKTKLCMLQKKGAKLEKEQRFLRKGDKLVVDGGEVLKSVDSNFPKE